MVGGSSETLSARPLACKQSLVLRHVRRPACARAAFRCFAADVMLAVQHAFYHEAAISQAARLCACRVHYHHATTDSCGYEGHRTIAGLFGGDKHAIFCRTQRRKAGPFHAQVIALTTHLIPHVP